VTVAASMSTFCFSVVDELLPLTTNAKTLTRPSAPVVQPASDTTSLSVPVLANTRPAAHFVAAVVKRPASVPVRAAVGSPAFSGHRVAWVPAVIPRSMMTAS